MYPNGLSGSQYELIKEGTQWKAKNDQMEVPASNKEVKSILVLLENLPTKQLISKSKDRQTDYELNEDTGKFVEVYSGINLLENLVVGRFNFNQATRQSVSYARLAEEDDIYAIDGFLSMTLVKDFNTFRNKNLGAFDPLEVQSFTFTNEGNMLIYEKKEGGTWQSSSGMTIDSSKMASYLNKIKNATGKDFLDGYQPQGNPNASLKLEVAGRSLPWQVDYFHEGDNRIFKSAENDAYFASDSLGLYKTLIQGLNNLNNGH